MQRYSKEELEKYCTSLFYESMATSESMFYQGKFIPCSEKVPTMTDIINATTKESMKENRERKKLLAESMGLCNDSQSTKNILKAQMALLDKEYNIFAETNMANQKKIYKETQCLDYSRSITCIHLNKKLNPLYDDLVLEVIFYDDASYDNGKYSEYKKLSTKEERIDFIKKNTEITHMALVSFNNGRRNILFPLVGKVVTENDEKTYYTPKGCHILPRSFVDFSKLTLDQIENEVNNNDVAQFLQSKIDLDKEAFALKAEKYIGMDNYKILASKSGTLFIRYVCPSTQRVYYNALSLRNLSFSRYFTEGDFESYINSWWSINNLGADIDEPMIRC